MNLRSHGTTLQETFEAGCARKRFQKTPQKTFWLKKEFDLSFFKVMKLYFTLVLKPPLQTLFSFMSVKKTIPISNQLYLSLKHVWSGRRKNNI